MSEIADFLTAQYDRIEKRARAASSGPWRVGDVVAEPSIADVYGPDGRVTSAREEPCCSVEDAEHMAFHDPTYVLADIKSKRRIIEEHAMSTIYAYINEGPECTADDEKYPCLTLRLLAAPFSGEPGYKPEWAL